MFFNSENNFNRTLAHSMVLFIPVALLCFLGISILYDYQKKLLHAEIYTDEIQFIEIGIHSIGDEIKTITSDINYLVSTENFISTVKDTLELPVHQQLLEQDWVTFISSKRIYDQIRWLDNNGHEKVRVNYNQVSPQIVSTNHLQDKSNRYYFNKAYALKQGEFYISELDLNVEFNRIEIPVKPMIRVASPIFTDSGTQKGLIVLNYLAQNLLDKFSHFKSRYDSNHWLINKQGYWLKGPNRDIEWGFMYEKPENTMASVYPEAWEKIISRNHGQFVDDDGLWTFSTVSPLFESLKSTQTLPSNIDHFNSQYLWKSVVFLPRDELEELNQSTILQVKIIALFILSGFFIGSWSLARAWLKKKDAEEELLLANQGLEEKVSDRTEQLYLAKLKAEQLAITDDLTGMNNRRSFFQQGQMIAGQAMRYGLTFSIMMIDIDHFKQVNDIHGHAAGDKALKKVAEIITNSIRSHDIAGRIGGEEFAIVLPQTRSTEALDLAERLRIQVESLEMPIPDNILKITTSIGVGEYSDGHRSLDDVLEIADKALYQAKDQGRNKVTTVKD